MNQLGQLIRVFSLLSLLAVGGGTAVLPALKRHAVDEERWLTEAQFRDAYSLGQVAPGPNMLMVTVIGYRVAGVPGAVAVTLAFFLPACLIALFVGRVWERFHGSPWRSAIQHGLAPVSLGLICAGVLSLGRVAISGPTTLLFAAVVFAVPFWRHVHPTWLVFAGAVGGALLLRG